MCWRFYGLWAWAWVKDGPHSLKVALVGLVLGWGADETLTVYTMDRGIQGSPVLEIHSVRNLVCNSARNPSQFL